MLECNSIGNVNVSLAKCNASQPTGRPTLFALELDMFNRTDYINGIHGENSTSKAKNETHSIPSDFQTNLIPSSNHTVLDGSMVKSSSSSFANSSSHPSQEPTAMPTNNSLPAQGGSTTTNSSNPSNWYDYWRTSSKPTSRPTNVPTYYPTTEPTLDPDGPTASPTQSVRVNKSSSTGQNYEFISSMTALVFIAMIVAALYVTKRHLGRKKKSKSKVVLHSPFFSELSKRVKERKKLMEEYFEIDAAECTILHRSAASSIDLQISTEFIDISREKQQSIY